MGDRSTFTAYRAARGAVLMTFAVVLAACAPVAAPSAVPPATPTPSPAPATVAAATPQPTATEAASPSEAAPGSASSVVTLEIGEDGAGYYVKADQRILATGEVTFRFTNTGRQRHELLVYPVQDVSQLLARGRRGDATEAHDLLEKVALVQEDIAPGADGSITAKLAPGIYEIACFMTGRDRSGTAFTHYDKGETLTLAVTGPGGPSPSVATPANTLKIQMQGDEAASWLFAADRLVVSAGQVTFEVKNNMRRTHEFIVHRLGDVSMFTAMLLEGGMPHGAMHELLEPLDGKELVEDLAAGSTTQVQASLGPGLWVAACYLVDEAGGAPYIHSDRGQRVVFEVR